jgi:hypothetical protein
VAQRNAMAVAAQVRDHGLGMGDAEGLEYTTQFVAISASRTASVCAASSIRGKRPASMPWRRRLTKPPRTCRESAPTGNR